MGMDERKSIFLTKQDLELCEPQQLTLDSSESFDFKQGYDSVINEIHSQYNLRSKKTNDPSNKTKAPNQNKKKDETPKNKILQILPRENKQNSTPSSPKIVDITNQIAQSSNPVKATILDPKKSPVDAKSTNSKTDNQRKPLVDNSKTDKPSTATQTTFEKINKDSSNQQNQNEKGK